MTKALHLSEAMKIISDKQPHRLEVWEISTGNLLLYPAAVLIGKFPKRGIFRLRLSPSGEIRACREIAVHSVDNMKVYY